MEYDWERTFPFLEIDNSTVEKLFQDILQGQDITRITPINEGCRTTNYIIETNNFKKKYILKIFFLDEQNYAREIKLLTKLKEGNVKNIPKIHKVNSHEIINNREYAIYDYIEGKTIGQAVSEGYTLGKNFIKDVAKFLAEIHSYRFEKVGFLDKNLKVEKELPPLITWYENFMGGKARKRLGKDIIDEVKYIVSKNKEILIQLDSDARLVHGDFQGTNILINSNRLCGIIDWEFVMAGHPLADIGQFFRYEEYFNNNLLQVFREEYNKNSSYVLTENWYNISKLRDLVNLLQLINGQEDMPNKYKNIKSIIIKSIKLLSS